MIAECQQYLTEKLRETMGQQTAVFYTQKQLAAHMESHVAAVLIDADALVRSNRRVADRRQLYTRTVTVNVILGEYTLETLEGYYVSFLQALGSGVQAGDLYISMEPGTAEWIYKADSLLKAEVAVNLQLICTGAVCQAERRMALRTVEATVEMEGDHGE